MLGSSSTLCNRAYYTHPSQFSHSKPFLSSHRPHFWKKSKLRSLSLISPRKQSKGSLGIRALEEPEVSESVTSDGPLCSSQPCSIKIPVGDRHVSSKFEFHLSHFFFLSLYLLFVQIFCFYFNFYQILLFIYFCIFCWVFLGQFSIFGELYFG
jgi:hypothetical protein